jgi:septal ring factor EnvC (AmiA/AmiB activator)
LETQSTQLESQLEERRRNLRIIEECIEADPQRNEKLVAVRGFLIDRIKRIEEELASDELRSRGTREAVSIAS